MTRFAMFAAATLFAGFPPFEAGEANAAPAHAQLRTATFAIGKMTCASCPITVKAAMSRVSGVSSVSIDFAAKSATVTFDPARANLAEIAAASTNAGYPAMPVR